MDVKGLKLEGEVDIMSFNYLVMPDKLMEARSFEGSVPRNIWAIFAQYP